MFCPEGFHLIHEIEEMARNIVDAKLPWSPPETAVKLAEKEERYLDLCSKGQSSEIFKSSFASNYFWIS